MENSDEKSGVTRFTWKRKTSKQAFIIKVREDGAWTG